MEVGDPIPKVSHPVSVALPTWEACIASQEGEAWVLDKLKFGYPRYYLHPKLIEYKSKILLKHGGAGLSELDILPFSAQQSATECAELIKVGSGDADALVTVLGVDASGNESDTEAVAWHVIFPKDDKPHAMLYWRLAGQGMSSRQAEYLLARLSGNSTDHTRSDVNEEQSSSSLVKERIAELIRDSAKQVAGKEPSLSQTDVTLFPSGMSAIYNAHKVVLAIFEEKNPSVCFGFPFVDTLRVLQTFGHEAIFLGLGDDSSLDELEHDLKKGSLSITSLWCETPSNPLLKMPNLKRIRQLADSFNFAVVLDDTLGNFSNVYVLQHADIVVSSLTKVFSGACDVMAGSIVLNPMSRYYSRMKEELSRVYQDLMFVEDVKVLEENSRTFKVRSATTDNNASALIDLLEDTPKLKNLFYPSLLSLRAYYDEVKVPTGGYGGLFTMEFHTEQHAKVFYDSLKVSKGPSLGTNFTLACPYTILAHYKELEGIIKWGVTKNMVRVSVGLEDTSFLLQTFQESLNTL